MNKLYFLFTLFLSIFIISCSEKTEFIEDSEEEFENTPQIELFYSYNSRDRIKLSTSDTIPNIKLGDTLFIYIKKIEQFSISFLEDYGYQEVQSEDDDFIKYQYLLPRVGLLFNYITMTNTEESWRCFTHFFINVNFSTETTIVLSDTPFYTIDIEDEATYRTVLSEITDYWPYPTQRIFYRLTFLEANRGLLELSLMTGNVLETTEGTFTTNAYASIASGLIIHLENEDYELMGDETAITSSDFVLQRDFTDEFRQKYPTGGINQIIISTKAYQASQTIRYETN